MQYYETIDDTREVIMPRVTGRWIGKIADGVCELTVGEKGETESLILVGCESWKRYLRRSKRKGKFTIDEGDSPFIKTAVCYIVRFLYHCRLHRGSSISNNGVVNKPDIMPDRYISHDVLIDFNNTVDKCDDIQIVMLYKHK